MSPDYREYVTVVLLDRSGCAKSPNTDTKAFDASTPSFGAVLDECVKLRSKCTQLEDVGSARDCQPDREA